MTDQAEMIFDHFPGIYFLSCTSMADHESNSITFSILYSTSVQSSPFFP